MKLVNKTKQVLEQYGFNILRNYKTGDEHVLVLEHVLLFISKDKISVAFEVLCKPQFVANFVILLLSITSYVTVMESYIFENGKMIIGDEAYEYISKKFTEEVKTQLWKQLHYNTILQSVQCYNC